MTRVLRILTASAVGLAIVAASTSAASASVLKAKYDASGSSYTARNNSTITLAKTTLSTVLNNDGTFTGTLPFKPATSSFKAFGLIPTTSTVNFIPVGKVTGRLSANGTHVDATSIYTLKLTDVTVGGHPFPVGDSCQTVNPVTIPVATPAGQTFDITKGGTVAGTYSIGQFANCGLLTCIINQLVPGDGNTVTLVLRNGRFQQG